MCHLFVAVMGYSPTCDVVHACTARLLEFLMTRVGGVHLETLREGRHVSMEEGGEGVALCIRRECHPNDPRERTARLYRQRRKS